MDALSLRLLLTATILVALTLTNRTAAHIDNKHNVTLRLLHHWTPVTSSQADAIPANDALPLQDDDSLKLKRLHSNISHKKQFSRTLRNKRTALQNLPHKPPDPNLNQKTNFGFVPHHSRIRGLLKREDKLHPSQSQQHKSRPQSQFRGLSSNSTSRLDFLTARDPLAAILEFIELARVEGACGTARLPLDSPVVASLAPPLVAQVSAAIQTANTLTNVFRHHDPSTDDALYEALIRGLAADRLIHGAGVIFDPDQTPEGAARYVTPYWSRDVTSGILRPTNVSRESRGRYAVEGTEGYEWYWRQRKDHSGLLWPHRHVCDPSGGRGVPLAPWGEPGGEGDVPTAVASTREGVWGTMRYECGGRGGEGVWVVPYSVPFFGCSSQRTLAFKGVVRVDLALSALDIDQCARWGGPFSATHRCPPATQCMHVPGAGFRRGSYRCECPRGSYGAPPLAADPHAPAAPRPFNLSYSLDGYTLEEDYARHLMNESEPATSVTTMDYEGFRCLRCAEGCDQCEDAAPCHVTLRDVTLLRGVALGAELCSLLVILALIGAVVKLRRNKVLTAGFWCLLELNLTGAFLLHFSVCLQYVDPLDLVCTLALWCREIGFTLAYGTLILRIYKIRSEFRSQTKRRTLPVQNRDLFRVLWTLVVVSLAYLASWTAVTLDPLEPLSSGWGHHGGSGGAGGFGGFKSLGGLKGFGVGGSSGALVEGDNPTCEERWCDYIIEAAESVLLGLGAWLCYRTRASFARSVPHSAPRAPSPSSGGLRETRCISVALFNEAFFSTVYYFVRHWMWHTLHADYMLLFNCIRTQLTVSVALILVIGPKIWHACGPCGAKPRTIKASSRSPAAASGGAAAPAPDRRAPLTGPPGCATARFQAGNTRELDELDLASMSQADIRVVKQTTFAVQYEFTRLYTQLQIYKTKTMRLDNPHISKRRGGRKLTHRRFSLQAFGALKNKPPSSAPPMVGPSQGARLAPGLASGRHRAGGITAGGGRELSAGGACAPSMANTEDTASRSRSLTLTPDESSNSAECGGAGGSAGGSAEGVEGGQAGRGGVIAIAPVVKVTGPAPVTPVISPKLTKTSESLLRSSTVPADTLNTSFAVKVAESFTTVPPAVELDSTGSDSVEKLPLTSVSAAIGPTSAKESVRADLTSQERTSNGGETSRKAARDCEISVELVIQPDTTGSMSGCEQSTAVDCTIDERRTAVDCIVNEESTAVDCIVNEESTAADCTDDERNTTLDRAIDEAAEGAMDKSAENIVPLPSDVTQSATLTAVEPTEQ